MYFGSAQYKHKGFAQPLLLLLSFIVLVVGGTYFYFRSNSIVSPKTIVNQITNNSVKSTKDYSSPLGFKFKYKSELIAKEDSEENFNKRGNGNFRKNFTSYVQYEPGKFLGSAVVLQKEDDFEKNPFSVWVFENPNDLTIDAWYKNYWYYPFVWGDFTYTGKFELAPKTEATVSGKIALSGTIDYQPGKPKFVYLSNDKKIYLFRIIGSIGEEILSTFKLTNIEVKNTGNCKIGGCSGQLCAEESDRGISTCEYKTEYGCYTKDTKCERQTDGKCGWTQTEQLKSCLEKSRDK